MVYYRLEFYGSNNVTISCPYWCLCINFHDKNWPLDFIIVFFSSAILGLFYWVHPFGKLDIAQLSFIQQCEKTLYVCLETSNMKTTLPLPQNVSELAVF